MTTITTSIFESNLDIVVNPVNTVGVMGKGLAAEFKDRYPDMYKLYRQKCLSGTFIIGSVFLWDVEEDLLASISPYVGIHEPRVIVNLPTKAHWRNPSFWTQIEPGAREMVRALKYVDYPRFLGCRPKVGVPRLGSGLGGLPWSEVKPKLEAILAQLEPAYEIFFVEPKL